MISPTELKIQRNLTALFIAADRIELTLNRRVSIEDGAGGHELIWQPLLPQTVRMNPLQDRVGERVTADGVQVAPSYMLIGGYDLDLQRFDRFTIDGRRYEVVFIQENRQYEVKGEVAYIGGQCQLHIRHLQV